MEPFMSFMPFMSSCLTYRPTLTTTRKLPLLSSM